MTKLQDIIWDYNYTDTLYTYQDSAISFVKEQRIILK